VDRERLLRDAERTREELESSRDIFCLSSLMRGWHVSARARLARFICMSFFLAIAALGVRKSKTTGRRREKRRGEEGGDKGEKRDG
jgi:hypothetical protein